MKEATRELIALLVECGAVQFGDFTLKSGEKSPFFVDLGCVATGRQLLSLGDHLGRGLVEGFPDVTALFGPPYKGIVLATVAAEGLRRVAGRDVGVCFNRKEAKGHGEKGVFFGARPGEGDRVVIVDDVLSSGGTKLEAARAVEEGCGVRPVGVLVVVDRARRGHTFTELPLASLVNVLDLAQYLAEAGDVRGELVRRFYDGRA